MSDKELGGPSPTAVENAGATVPAGQLSHAAKWDLDVAIAIILYPRVDHPRDESVADEVERERAQARLDHLANQLQDWLEARLRQMTPEQAANAFSELTRVGCETHSLGDMP